MTRSRRFSALLRYLLVVTSLSARVSFADVQVWAIVPERSEVRIQVGKSGLLSAAGHTHEVMAPAVTGSVRLDPQRIQEAEIELTFDAAALKVTGKGEPPEDVPEVQQTMLSAKVLDVERYPKIIFRSRRIDLNRRGGDQLQLRVLGSLTLHGVTRPIEAPVDVKLTPDRLTGTGKLSIKQTDFGIKPVTAGLGTVRVRDEVSVTFTFAAQR